MSRTPVVEERLDLQEASPDVAVERPNGIPVVAGCDITGPQPTRQQRTDFDHGQAADQSDLLSADESNELG